MDNRTSIKKTLWQIVAVFTGLIIVYSSFCAVNINPSLDSLGVMFQIAMAILIITAALTSKVWIYRLSQWGCSINLVFALMNAFQYYIKRPFGSGVSEALMNQRFDIIMYDSMRLSWLMVFSLVALHFIKSKNNNELN